MPTNSFITSPNERFWKYVKKTKDCWMWDGAISTTFKYGAIQGRDSFGKKIPIYAHRLSYEMHYGPIPKGKCILHICDNPPCVNPKHLRMGTQKDNMQDMWNKKRGGNQFKKNIGYSHLKGSNGNTPCRKLA